MQARVSAAHWNPVASTDKHNERIAILIFLVVVLSLFRPHLHGTGALVAPALPYSTPIGVIMAFTNTLIIALGDLATQGVVQACSSPYSFGSLVGLALSIVPRVDTRALGSMPDPSPR
ncbi:hypothetical protein BGY98DRAFT_1009160 [Russula aff. rugulosa BPL654]|nr:hypothetical protein BGY98DRAFT_1009160 [Russula aff. rugulosa BPL654]